MHLTIDRVRLDIIGKNFERIGMYKQGVALGEINCHSTIRTHGIACLVIVLPIIAGQAILIDSIGIYHIIVGLTNPLLFIMPDTVTDKGLSLVCQNRTFQQPSTVILGIVIASFRIYMTLSGCNVSRPNYLSHRGMRVIIERIGGEIHILVTHLYVVVKHRLF